jgi:hypothetical protein
MLNSFFVCISLPSKVTTAMDSPLFLDSSLSLERLVRHSRVGGGPLLAALGLGVLLILAPGCSSNDDQMAAAPVTPLPAAAPAPATPVADDGSGEVMEDAGDGGDGGEVDDGTGEAADGEVDDGTGEATEGEVMESDGGDDPSMNDAGGEVDGNMADGGGDPADGDGSIGLPPAKPKTLREQADQAFREGYEKAAVRLLQAHLLATPAEAAELLAHYRWSPSRRQPQLLARVAVGVDLVNPYSEFKDLKPIGSVRLRTSSRGRTPAANADNFQEDTFQEDTFEDGPGLSTFLAPNDKERVLQKYAGLMGDGLVQHVRDQHAHGLWSPYFQSNVGVVTQAAAFSNFAGGDEVDPNDGIDDSTGFINRGHANTPLDTKIAGAEAKYLSLGPTLSFIGVTKTADLVERAKAGRFDALVVYDVEISVNRRLRLIYNDCKARLINLVDGKPLATSKQLKNTEAAKELAKAGNDLIAKSMQPVTSALDAKVALTDLPTALTAEIIKSKRLGALTSLQEMTKLEALAEIRLWREKGLLTEEELAVAFGQILGEEEGRTLAAGSDEERREVVLRLLAEAPSP